MAITIDWGGTNAINVPQADLTPVSGTLYELDVDWFRLQLKALEAGADGMPFPVTHVHNTEITLAGLTFARTVEILSPYTVTFEDGQYTVRCVSANHNIADVKNANQVSLITQNSAGLIKVTTGSGLDANQATQLAEVWQMQGLDNANPLTKTPTTFTVGGVTITITGDGVTTSTATRQ